MPIDRALLAPEPVTESPSNLTAADYRERIERVVTYLSEHLDEALTLQRLAKVACFSPYHFHRIYRSVLNETPNDTLRRLRLYRAALDLLDREQTIAAVAKRAAYGSQAAFTRAFTEEFGRPPARYRTYQERSQLECATLIETMRIRSKLEMNQTPIAIPYEVEIVNVEGARLMAMPHRGDYQLISRAFERLGAIAGPLGLYREARMIGLYYDDPDTVATDDLRSAACLSLKSDVQLPPGCEETVLQAGKYARVVHVGPYPELPRAYDALYRLWLPQSGATPRNAPCVEEYLNTPSSAAAKDLRTYVMLPIED